MLHRLTLRVAAGLAAAVFMLGASADAGTTPLDTATARRFVQSLEPMKPLGKSLQDQGFMSDVKPSDMISGGQFAPYAASLARLNKEHPDVYISVDQIARANGFASAIHWATTGDRVMLAYMLIKHPEMISMADSVAMPPMQEMPDDMPPETRAMIEARMKALAEQIEPVKIMAQSLKTVSENDKAAVAPVVEMLDTELNSGPFTANSIIKPGMGWGR